jgi:replicative DNA helicase
MTNVDTLAKYGTLFQSKVISVLLDDKMFLEQVYDIVDSKYFDSDGNQWIVSKIIWYFMHYKNIPTMQVFKSEMDKETDELKSSIIPSLREAYNNIKSIDAQYIKDEFLKFCRNQSMKNAILRSADLLKSGQYDDIKSLVTKAIQAGEARDFGHIWKTDLDDRLVHTARNTIATGWPVIDNLMDGGLAAGELGVIIAPSGIGKSWFLSRIGHAAVKNNKKVVHYTFELNQVYSGLRYDTLTLGVEPNQVKNHRSNLEKIIQGIGGELAVKYFPTRTVSTSTLMADIHRRINTGFTPDLVIIDYADLMRPTDRADNRYQELGIIYEDIRGMLGELGIPGWTASQTQRSGLNEDVIEADKIAESFAKIMTADFAMSVSRKLEDKLANTARAHVMKNRFGPDGCTKPCEVDYSRGIVEIYDENSPKGLMLKRKMQQGEGQVKEMLRQKLKDFKSSNSLIEDGDDLG